jgi:hypothetical protein
LIVTEWKEERIMLKNSRHTQPLYLTRLVNIFFSFFFFNLFTSHLKIWRMTMEKEITVDVSCSEMQWWWQEETWYKLDWHIYFKNVFRKTNSEKLSRHRHKSKCHLDFSLKWICSLFIILLDWGGNHLRRNPPFEFIFSQQGGPNKISRRLKELGSMGLLSQIVAVFVNFRLIFWYLLKNWITKFRPEFLFIDRPNDSKRLFLRNSISWQKKILFGWNFHDILRVIRCIIYGRSKFHYSIFR